MVLMRAGGTVLVMGACLAPSSRTGALVIAVHFKLVQQIPSRGSALKY
jgi:hypothetical protein